MHGRVKVLQNLNPVYDYGKFSDYLLNNKFSFKKVIASIYTKISNSSGFNPILQNYYEMICEISVSKTVCGFFLFLFRKTRFSKEN